MKKKLKEYSIYGHDRGSKASPRYLFTIKSYNSKQAMRQAKFRVKGAKIIDRVKLS